MIDDSQRKEQFDPKQVQPIIPKDITADELKELQEVDEELAERIRKEFEKRQGKETRE